MIPFDPADVWSWSGGAVAPPDPTQDAIRGATISPGTLRRVDVLGAGAVRGATVTPGTTRRTQ
jgi:hypothetical protein